MPVTRAQITQRDAPTTAGQSSAATTLAWVPKHDLDLAEWSLAGQRLGMVDRCSPWWIGDWIRYGNAKFGEKYGRAAKITGYDVQTLMNRVYVASHIEISRRRENLSWSHHEAVASLAPEVQDRWLDAAIEHKMSVADMRLELRARHTRRGKHAVAAPAEEGAESEDEGIECPNCGHRISSYIFAEKLKTLVSKAQPMGTTGG